MFVKPLHELRLSFGAIYVTNTNMAVLQHSFFCSFTTRENGLKDVKIIKSMSMLRAAAKQTEFVSSVRDRY